MTKENLLDSISKAITDPAFIGQTESELMIHYMNLKSLIVRSTGQSYSEVSKQYD